MNNRNIFYRKLFSKAKTIMIICFPLHIKQGDYCRKNFCIFYSIKLAGTEIEQILWLFFVYFEAIWEFLHNVGWSYKLLIFLLSKFFL